MLLKAGSPGLADTLKQRHCTPASAVHTVLSHTGDVLPPAPLQARLEADLVPLGDAVNQVVHMGVLPAPVLRAQLAHAQQPVPQVALHLSTRQLHHRLPRHKGSSCLQGGAQVSTALAAGAVPQDAAELDHRLPGDKGGSCLQCKAQVNTSLLKALHGSMLPGQPQVPRHEGGSCLQGGEQVSKSAGAAPQYVARPSRELWATKGRRLPAVHYFSECRFRCVSAPLKLLCPELGRCQLGGEFMAIYDFARGSFVEWIRSATGCQLPKAADALADMQGDKCGTTCFCQVVPATLDCTHLRLQPSTADTCKKQVPAGLSITIAGFTDHCCPACCMVMR